MIMMDSKTRLTKTVTAETCLTYKLSINQLCLLYFNWCYYVRKYLWTYKLHIVCLWYCNIPDFTQTILLRNPWQSYKTSYLIYYYTITRTQKRTLTHMLTV